MKQISLISLLLFLILTGCKKDDSPPTSGTVTLDNNLYGTGPYYANGFSFTQAKIISTLESPSPDLSVNNDDIPGNLMFEANTNLPAFFLQGQYTSSSEAEAAFRNLTSLQVPSNQWVGIAHLIKPNQIWIYRSGTEHYTKIRIVSTSVQQKEPFDYVECTFEWVYQPDGSLTFPSK